ncbi:pleckstrin homology domain-containing family A member 3-like isoform X2 [Hemiscyllium ocellatum]|uniref:pleckstrin homology domain-containing family A member 3-like isoform X2 n=1 Tax=Hemiscyllium ocellatum TaxID=170820 RepID=UPI0029675526|nr:pleckstrin homology domain-containing family A member 3-like isoform X2 [Hemiscyllium ocellatum]
MEGVLHKWTNYLSGWQPRYFVLDGTVLSYYDSQEDVGKGSKGSIKMAVCEIKVHTADFTRMDLIIPGEQYFYLKAVNAAERQKWLVALGSAKACLADSRSKKEREISETEDTLKSKMSELRLYCDLLMQQVHKIQESAQPLQDSSTPDVEKMNEASSLLKATCNTFINTLEDCMKIASVKISPELLSPPESPVAHVTSTPLRRVKRSVSHSGVVPPDRHAEINNLVQPPKGSITVMRNLEEMAAHRASRRTRSPVENKTPDDSFAAQPENLLPPSQSVQDESASSANGE